jgi:hypothetical protein
LVRLRPDEAPAFEMFGKEAQTGEAAAHVGHAGRDPDARVRRRRDHRPSCSRMVWSVAGSTGPSTRTSTRPGSIWMMPVRGWIGPDLSSMPSVMRPASVAPGSGAHPADLREAASASGKPGWHSPRDGEPPPPPKPEAASTLQQPAAAPQPRLPARCSHLPKRQTKGCFKDERKGLSRRRCCSQTRTLLHRFVNHITRSIFSSKDEPERNR